MLSREIGRLGLEKTIRSSTKLSSFRSKTSKLTKELSVGVLVLSNVVRDSVIFVPSRLSRFISLGAEGSIGATVQEGVCFDHLITSFCLYLHRNYCETGGRRGTSTGPTLTSVTSVLAETNLLVSFCSGFCSRGRVLCSFKCRKVECLSVQSCTRQKLFLRQAIDTKLLHTNKLVSIIQVHFLERVALREPVICVTQWTLDVFGVRHTGWY